MTTKPKKPNNFPREGQHSPVTKDAVARLQSQRPVPNSVQEYTIGGSIETAVHSNDNAEREAAITYGARTLNQSAHAFRDDFKRAEKVRARAAYIRAQQTAAKETPAQVRHRVNTPSR